MTSSRRKQVELDDAKAGMVLAEPVVDPRGGVLLPGATELTAATLASLQRRGIDRIFVVDDTVSDEEARAEQERTAQRLAYLFRKCGTGSACGDLLLRITEYRQGNVR